MSEDKKWMRLEKKLSAPIEKVWSLWTSPDHFKAWYGPNGMSVPVAEFDLKPGGNRRVCMQRGDGEDAFKMWFTGQFKEIDDPVRLVYTESMSDEKGNLISPQAMGMPADFPEVTEVIVELEKSGQNTLLKLIHIGVPKGSGGEGGWAQALDKLSAYIAES